MTHHRTQHDKDPFMPDATTDPPATRELACRRNDGLCVRLLWHPRQNDLTVSVTDSRDGESFDFAVEGSRALEAFNHPFAYAG